MLCASDYPFQFCYYPIFFFQYFFLFVKFRLHLLTRNPAYSLGFGFVCSSAHNTFRLLFDHVAVRDMCNDRIYKTAHSQKDHQHHNRKACHKSQRAFVIIFFHRDLGDLLYGGIDHCSAGYRHDIRKRGREEH